MRSGNLDWVSAVKFVEESRHLLEKYVEGVDLREEFWGFGSSSASKAEFSR